MYILFVYLKKRKKTNERRREERACVRASVRASERQKKSKEFRRNIRMAKKCIKKEKKKRRRTKRAWRGNPPSCIRIRSSWRWRSSRCCSARWSAPRSAWTRHDRLLTRHCAGTQFCKCLPKQKQNKNKLT